MNVRVEHYGIEGTGRNVTEAKRDAGDKIKRALTGNYDPIILAEDGIAYLLYRSPEGWHGRFLTDENGKIRDGAAGWSSGGALEDTLASAALSLAQSAWNHERPADWTPAVFLKVPHTFRRRIENELSSWIQFQRAYRHAKDCGATDQQCHQWAGWYGREFAEGKRTYQAPELATA